MYLVRSKLTCSQDSVWLLVDKQARRSQHIMLLLDGPATSKQSASSTPRQSAIWPDVFPIAAIAAGAGELPALSHKPLAQGAAEFASGLPFL